MAVLTLDARRIGYLLGLGDLQREPICHGYANGDRCEGCLEREERVRVLAENPLKRFPWEEAA